MSSVHDDLPPFLRHTGIEIEDWRDGIVVVGMRIEPFHLNRFGIVHGGVYSVLADSAGGLAGCYSADPGARRAAFTITLTTSFLDRASTGRMRATGTVMRNGRQVYYSNVDIDCDGRRVAIAQGSFMRAGVRPRGAAAAASAAGTPAAAPAMPGDTHGH